MKSRVLKQTEYMAEQRKDKDESESVTGIGQTDEDGVAGITGV